MTTETYSAAARDAVAATLAATDRHDLDGLTMHAHPDWIEDVVAVGRLVGADAVRAFYAETFAAFPDFRIEVERLVGDGPVVVAEWHATGTFTGASFQGIQPTQRSVELRGIDVFEFEDGLIIRSTVYYDGATFARQIGLLPARGSLADRATLTAFNAVTRIRTTLSRPFRGS